jgi:AAA+ ATPase superfamily predicted ATPase
VLGADFEGRQAELASAWDNLKQGNSLLLASPRRVGKSSFARKLVDIARTNEADVG